MTLSNNFYDGGLNTSLLTYFHPISSKLSSLLFGNRSNLSISLLIKNLNKNAINIVSSNRIIVFKLNDFHCNSSLSNFLYTSHLEYVWFYNLKLTSYVNMTLSGFKC